MTITLINIFPLVVVVRIQMATMTVVLVPSAVVIVGIILKTATRMMVMVIRRITEYRILYSSH